MPRAPEPTPPSAVAAPEAKAQPSREEPPKQQAPAQPAPPLRAGLEIEVPAGRLRVGSATASTPRDPAREADGVALELPAFFIDALPHPNDPSKPVTTGVDRKEAARLCTTQGKRLCHELEWERACKGDENAIYPVLGREFDALRCRVELSSCASATGTYAMGALGREWTASPTTRGLGDSLRTAVVRGAATEAPAVSHRCAARDAATPDSKSSTLTFRCCRGPTPALSYPEEPARPAVAPLALDRDALRTLLASLPQTKDLGERFVPSSEADVDASLRAARSSRSRMAPWIATGSLLAWSPVHGEEVWVLSGDTPEGALLIAIYPGREGPPIVIGSLLARNEHAAFVVAHKPDMPRELLFSTCWGCGGEGGALTLRDDGSIALEAR